MISLNQSIQPCPELARYINCYNVFDDDGFFKGLEVITLENGITEMMIQLGDPTVFYNKSRNIRNQYYISLTGQYLDYVVIETIGHSLIISVNFKPGGMYAIFGIPQDYYVSKNINFEDVVNRNSSLLWEALMGKKNLSERIRCIEQFLIQRLRRSKLPVLEMSNIAQFIREHEGNINVHNLAEMAGVSLRTFSRRFRSQIGVTPKQYAEIIRLNSVCKDMAELHSHDLLSIALRHGYYDASHLINSFKNYLHLTPSEFAKQLLRDVGYTAKFTLVGNSLIR